MRVNFWTVVGCGLGLGLMAAPVLAHHAFAAEYDDKKPVVLTGRVAKMEWVNPHSHIYLDVTDDTGKVTNWLVSMGSPNGLIRNGWKRDSLKIGDTITVNGFLAKDGSKMADGRNVKFPDGRNVFAGSAGDGGPPVAAPSKQ
jgi:hypothetical protein